MIVKKDYHMHTTFCDGQNTPREMVEAGINKGFQTLGFSGHSYTFFDESWCMTKEGTRAYIKEITQLKIEYKSKIEILCGIEQDYYSDMSIDDYDYVIGSVHYLKKNGVYLPVDESKEILLEIVRDFYVGDIYTLIEDYYLTVADVRRKTQCNIIGHFDLITKFNENNELFDENCDRYKRAYLFALNQLNCSECLFEINTGCVSRGYKSIPYPSISILEEIHHRKGKFIFTGDSHDTAGIGYDFDSWFKKYSMLGFNIVQDVFNQ